LVGFWLNGTPYCSAAYFANAFPPPSGIDPVRKVNIGREAKKTKKLIQKQDKTNTKKLSKQTNKQTNKHTNKQADMDR